jgi:hypothetical protein
VTDGTAVWTQTDFDVVNMNGEISAQNVTVGNIILQNIAANPTREITSDYTASCSDEMLLVDTSAGNRIITIPAACYITGKKYVIKKQDSSANTVTIHGNSNAIDLNADYVIPGGSRGYVVLEYAGGGKLSGAHWIVAQSSFSSFAVRLINESNTPVKNSTETKLIYNTEVRDDGAMHSNSNPGRITFPVDGWYTFGATNRFVHDANGFRRQRILLNGTTVIEESQAAAIAAGGPRVTSNSETSLRMTGSRYFRAGDYIECVVFQNSGRTLDVEYINEYSPTFWAIKNP